MKKLTNKLMGTISISSKGTGYVKVLAPTGVPTEVGNDIEIDSRHLNTALHGDTVEIILHPKNKNRMTGEVTKIISLHRHFDPPRFNAWWENWAKSFCGNYFLG